MEKKRAVSYQQAIRSYDKSRGIKRDEFDIPLKHSHSDKLDDSVDYLAVSREYERYLSDGSPEAVHGDD